jgi:hypothetical protein
LRDAPEAPLPVPEGVTVHRIDLATGATVAGEEGAAEVFFQEFEPGALDPVGTPAEPVEPPIPAPVAADH